MKIINICVLLLSIPALSYAFGFGGGGGGRGVQTGTAGNYGLSMADNGASSFTCGDSVGHLFWESGVLKFCNPNSTTKITIGESGSSSDTTPNAFVFTDETGVPLSTAKISNAITVAGINASTAISVTGDTGYGYSKNSAACTATSGTVVAGDTVAACVTSSGSNSTATTATITIGGVADTYSVTTAAGGATYSDGFGSDTSANYTTIGTESLNGITVASGYAVAKNRWATNNVIRGSAGSASHYAQAKIQYHAVDASGLIVGASDAGSTTTTGYQVIPSSTTLIKLRSISGNTVTNRGEWTVPEMTVDTYYTVKIVKSGSTFALYLNGTHITPDVTDTTYTDGQYIGLSFDCSNGVFSPADDFEGGL